MILLDIAGFSGDLEIDLESAEGEAVFILLVEHAQAFLRVGRLTLPDWAALSVLERAAFVRAADLEQIGTLALSDPARAAAELARYDGGSAQRRRALMEAVSRVAERVTYGG